MSRITRRSLMPAVVAALALALPLTAPVFAAEEGVSVTVVFVDDTPDASPIPGANVVLQAHVTDFPEDTPLVELRGITDDNGVVVFEGVPVGAEGGPAVHLRIEAHAERHEIDANFCRTTESWDGFLIDVPSPPSGPVVVTVTGGSSSMTCRFLAGEILDPEGVARPADPLLSSISIELPDGGGAMSFPLLVEPDGSFRQPLPVWGTHEAPAVVRLTYVSVAETETVDGCVRSVVQSVTDEVIVPLESEDPPVLALVTAPAGGDTCGAVSPTQPPQATATLPPTDAGPSNGSPDLLQAGVGALLAALGVIAATAATAFIRRRRSA